MDSTKDYINRLPSQEETKKSLDRYFGFMHSKINTLGDMDISKIIKMQNKGWNMKSSKEEIRMLIDDFVNIYGYIYKEGRNTGGRLIRGTTTDEAKQMKQGDEVSRVLSTTTEEDIAKRFCEYDKAALIRIKADKGLPYLYVEDLKEDLGEEEEVLILPFSKVKASQLTSDWQGYKYYDVILEKGELPEISDEKLEQLKEMCIDGYEDFSEQLEEYETGTNREKLYNYKSQFQEMLKGMCRQREKDIDLQIEDERKRKEELRLEKLNEGIEKFEETLSKDSTIIQQNTESNVSDFINTINRFRNISNILGIRTFNSQNLEYDIQNRAGQITESEQQEVTEQDPDKKYGILLDMTQKYGTAKNLLQEMPELLNEYNNNSVADLRFNLNQKVQEIIYRTAMNSLNTERQMALSQKETFLNKLSGKNALNQAKVKNVEARMNYAAKRREISNPSNSINQMLTDLYECAYQFNGGNLTQEMIEIEEGIRKIFSNIPEQKDLATHAFVKQVNGLPAISNKKGIFSLITNRQDAKTLESQTLAINQEVSNANVPQRQNTNSNVNLINIYARYNDILEKVGKLVRTEDREQATQLRDAEIDIGEEK